MLTSANSVQAKFVEFNTSEFRSALLLWNSVNNSRRVVVLKTSVFGAPPLTVEIDFPQPDFYSRPPGSLYAPPRYVGIGRR